MLCTFNFILEGQSFCHVSFGLSHSNRLNSFQLLCLNAQRCTMSFDVDFQSQYGKVFLQFSSAYQSSYLNLHPESRASSLYQHCLFPFNNYSSKPCIKFAYLQSSLTSVFNICRALVLTKVIFQIWRR